MLARRDSIAFSAGRPSPSGDSAIGSFRHQGLLPEATAGAVWDQKDNWWCRLGRKRGTFRPSLHQELPFASRLAPWVVSRFNPTFRTAPRDAVQATSHAGARAKPPTVIKEEPAETDGLFFALQALLCFEDAYARAILVCTNRSTDPSPGPSCCPHREW